MNILVINLHSSKNIGDAAITVEMIKQLQENFPDANITLVLNDASSHPQAKRLKTSGSFKTWVLEIDENKREKWKVWAFPFQAIIAVVALLTYRLFGKPLFLTNKPEKRELIHSYISADIVISCGGQVLSTKRWLAASFYWISFSTLYAHWLGKPIYMFPQTIGPIATRHHQLIVDYVLKKTRLIMLRDEDMSLEAVTLPELLEKTVMIPDAAFGLPRRTPADGWNILKRFNLYPAEDTPTIGMTVMGWAGMNVNFTQSDQLRYEEAVAKLLQYIVNDLHGRVFLFAQVIGPSIIEDDRVTAKKVIELAGLQPPDVVLIDNLTELDDLLSAYATLDMLVGTRMHSNIMALVSGTPVCAIAYLLKKTSGILRWAGLHDSVCDINNIDGDKLVSLFQQSWQARHKTKASLNKIIPTLSLKAKQASKLIAEDWQKLSSGKR